MAFLIEGSTKLSKKNPKNSAWIQSFINWATFIKPVSKQKLIYASGQGKAICFKSECK